MQNHCFQDMKLKCTGKNHRTHDFRGIVEYLLKHFKNSFRTLRMFDIFQWSFRNKSNLGTNKKFNKTNIICDQSVKNACNNL